MEDIEDFVKLYIKDSGILEEKVEEIHKTLESMIKQETPYDQGRLKRSINTSADVYDNYGIITGTYDEGLAPHGLYVLSGSKAVDGKLMKMPWGYRTKRKAIPPNDFLSRGLQRILELYR